MGLGTIDLDDDGAALLGELNLENFPANNSSEAEQQGALHPARRPAWPCEASTESSHMLQSPASGETKLLGVLEPLGKAVACLHLLRKCWKLEAVPELEAM